MATCKDNLYTVEQAAEVLGIFPQAIREGIRTGRLPVGIAKKNKTRWAFYIYKSWVDRYLMGDPVTIPEGMSDREEPKKCEIRKYRQQGRPRL